MKPTEQFATFDSAPFMLQALAKFLHGEDTSSLLPVSPKLAKWGLLPVLRATGLLPDGMRTRIAAQLGKTQALDPEQLAMVNTQQIAEYVTGLYPKRKYPMIAVGSSNGALTHLYAALGIPWLPQTLLTLVKRQIPPDEMVKDFEFGKEHAAAFLDANPGVALYQMSDPSNDRLMAQMLAYFRFKYLRLPDAYRAFLEENLEPGGTLLIVNCRQNWPVAVASDRHFYQTGGFGATSWEEYHTGGERVARFLQSYGSPHERFIVPEPVAEMPESEWGLDERLLEDLLAFARERRHPVRQVRFYSPEDPSPFVADLHCWWYQRLNRPTNMLFVENFMQMELYWSLRGGLVPFWLCFNGENSLAKIRAYLQTRRFQHIYQTLFSNTVHSIGAPTLAQWRSALNGEHGNYDLLGVNEKAFPIDLSSQVGYYFALKEKVLARASQPALLPTPLTLADLDTFISESDFPEVEWSMLE